MSKATCAFWVGILLLLLISFIMVGCSVPPWSDKQVKQMKSEDIKCVPVVRIAVP